MTDELSTPEPSDSAPTAKRPAESAADPNYPGWLPFILPLAVFSLSTYAEAYLEKSWGRESYPLIYTLKVALVAATLPFAWPVLRRFPIRISAWAPLAGLAGIVLWIGLAEVQNWCLARGYIPEGIASYLGVGSRVGFNPFEELEGTANIAWFLAIRFAGLVLLVPVVEELFLRGFLVRFMEDAEWWKVPIGQAGTMAFLSATVYGMATHPGELMAAAAWFTLISLLARHTRSLWDCIVAHAVTNLALGIYVLSVKRWELW